LEKDEGVQRGQERTFSQKVFPSPLQKNQSSFSTEPKLKDFPVFRERRASSSLKPHSKGLIRSGFKSKKAVAVSH